MAKQARDGGSIESGFDFSKFLDLDDDDLIVDGSTEDSDYQTIPHSRDEVVTGALHLDLDGPLEGYIKAGKVSWSDKRTLRKLAAENRELEAVLRDTDEALLERTVGYHELVSGLLREKNGFRGYALDDADPYDAQSKGSDSKPIGSAEARAKSSEIFKEIEELESHRSELNGKRTDALGDIREIAAKQENGGWEPLEGTLEDKLGAIERIQPITKVQFSEEDEALFEQGVGELTGYIDGSFDPLADEDEYDEDIRQDSVEEIPLSSDGHSEEEILAMEENAVSQNSDQSFTELFTDGRDELEEEAAESEEEPAEELHSEEFSSEETPDELNAALGEGYDPSAEGDASLEADSLEDHDYLGDYPEGEPSAELEGAADEELEADALEDDLSDSEPQTDEHFAEAENSPETGSEGPEDGAETSIDDEEYPEDAEEQAPDELASSVVSDLDVSDSEAEDFGALAETEDEEIASTYVDFSEYSSDTPTRAVIFEELKAKYGISFEGIPGLED